MANVCRYSELDNHSLKDVQHKDVVVPLHVLSVVEPTKVNVVISWEGNFMRECHKSRHGSGNSGNKDKSHQLLHKKGVHSKELLLVLAEGQTASMK